MRAKLGTMLMVTALALLVVGSAATYVEAKPKDKTNNGQTSAKAKTTKKPSSGKPDSQSTRQSGATKQGAQPGASRGVKNSGSIKVAQIGSGTEPNNEPKPGCTFRVDFYGFRAGVLDVTVRAISPTGDATLARDSVTLSRSARGNQYQTSRTYDVSEGLAGLTASNQGYHLRIDAKRADSNGNGSKTKVFWLNCAPDAEVQGTFYERRVSNTSSASSGAAPGVSGARVLGQRSDNGTFRVDGRMVASSDGARLEVLGARLAYTGLPLMGLSLLALALMMLGASLLLRAQPRPQN